MIYKIFLLTILISSGLFSQQSGIFKNPPPTATIPAVLTEQDGSPKTTGFGTMEAKWVPALTGDAESLLQSFSSGTDAGIKQTIKSVLTSANIPEAKINQIKISFTSSGIDELSVDKNAVPFKDDFPQKFEQEKMYLITKLYRAKNVKIELLDEGASDFDQAVSAAISDGLRFGNKTESNLGNKMTIEIQALIYGYEQIPFSIDRVSDSRTSLILGVLTEVGMNSIATLKALEGKPGDYFIRVGTSLSSESIEFNISTEVPTTSFRISNGERYSMSYIEKSGNKVTVSISGFKINFDQ